MTFTQLVAAAYCAAATAAAPFTPSRAQVEDRLAGVVDQLELMDDPEGYIRATFRPGTWDVVVIQLYRERIAGAR